MQSSVTLNSILENTSIYSGKDYILQSAYRKKDREYSPAQSTSASKPVERPRPSLETTRSLVIRLSPQLNIIVWSNLRSSLSTRLCQSPEMWTSLFARYCDTFIYLKHKRINNLLTLKLNAFRNSISNLCWKFLTTAMAIFNLHQDLIIYLKGLGSGIRFLWCILHFVRHCSSIVLW